MRSLSEGEGKMKKVLGLVAAVAMIAMFVSGAMAQPTATVTFLDNVDGLMAPTPFGITNDGSMFVGTDYWTGNAFYWTSDGGYTIVGPGEMWDVADDGTMVGDCYLPHPDFPEDVNQAAYYRIGEGWTAIGGVPGIDPWDAMWYSHAKGIARETGDKIIGMAWINPGDVVAYEWTFDNGWNTLEGDGDGESYKAIGVSGDGSVVVGWDQQWNGCRTAYSWTPDPTWLGTMFTTDPTWPHGEADATSDNGTYIVGGGLTDSLDAFGANVTNAFRYTTDDGMLPLGLLPGHEYLSWGNAVTNDGEVFGYSMSEFSPWAIREAFWWTEDGGMVSLADSLVALGAEIPEGYTLMNVLDVSNDGRFIIGFAQDLMWNNIGFIAEVNSDEPAPVTLTLSPTTTTVPAAGGDIVYDASIVSTLGNPMNGRAWTIVSAPNGNDYTTMNIPITVVPGTTNVNGLIQSVPAFAPEGTYTFTANLGNYPSFIGATDNFTFEKTGVAADGVNNWDASEWTITSDEMAAVEMPSAYQIAEIAPNPFNPTTTITLALPAASELNLRVVNVLGQQVATLADGKISAGNHSFVFDGANLASGVYFVHAVVPGEMNQIQKITLMK
jgi:uncharacterized membrane protein